MYFYINNTDSQICYNLAIKMHGFFKPYTALAYFYINNTV